MSRKKSVEPEPVTFTHTVDDPIPGYTICRLSEADITDLNAGKVPDWIIQTTDFWLRPNPKPSDVPKLTPEGTER